MSDAKIKRVLISVTNKNGIVEFANALHSEFGCEIISTGGSAKVLKSAGVEVTPISDVTNFPEMMDGRVKTLHPNVHGGLLAKRNNEAHMAQAVQHGIEMIDMVVVNLYEFEKTVNSGAGLDACVENIDIGGPAMLRSAAKNFESVTVVCNPSHYSEILEQMRANSGCTTFEMRMKLAREVFETTNAYDSAIANYLKAQMSDNSANNEGNGFSDDLTLHLHKVQDLRYGENPHQKAAFYSWAESEQQHSLVDAKQLNGKPLSYNNLLDTDACFSLVQEFMQPAVVILKHQNPCGSAVGQSIANAYDKAFECDPKSAYGGIIAANTAVSAEMVQHINDNKQFVEVIIAPAFEVSALKMLQKKKNLRVLCTNGMPKNAGTEIRSVCGGGVLVQQHDVASEAIENFSVPTNRKPNENEMDGLLFAWKVCKGVKSNAILVARDHAGIGMGPGQPNRVDSAHLACKRAHDACERMGVKPEGLVCASDAFFPFRDNIDELAKWGITAIIQPGGSIRDEEVIKACNEHNIAMVFTGVRHFRH